MKCKLVATGLVLIAENKEDVKEIKKMWKKRIVKFGGKAATGIKIPIKMDGKPYAEILLQSSKVSFSKQTKVDSIYDEDKDRKHVRFADIEKKFKRKFHSVRMSGGKATEEEILNFIKKLL